MTRRAKPRGKRPPASRSNRIQFLTPQPLADGSTVWHWKPSPRLRKAGWTNLKLGDDYATAVQLAITRNQEVEAWQQQRAANPAVPSRAPRKWTFGEVVRHFQDSAHWQTRLSEKTRRVYRSHLNWLTAWANDGDLLMDHLTGEVVDDLAETLALEASPHNAAARIAVLRLTLSYAVKPLRILRDNPAAKIGMAQPKPRTKRILLDTVTALIDHARQQDMPHVAQAVLLGFWSMQREGDLLEATRLNWKRMDDMAAEDLAVIAGDDGEAWGLQLRQGKTSKWVNAIIPPDVAATVQDHFARQEALAKTSGNVQQLASPLVTRADSAEPVPDWRLQRDFRHCATTLADSATAEGNQWLADQLAGLEFRDLRRSGMCWWRDHGATIPFIASQSGHSITYTTRILDTYMPGDQRASAAGLATVLRTTKARAKAKEQKA